MNVCNHLKCYSLDIASKVQTYDKKVDEVCDLRGHHSAVGHGLEVEATGAPIPPHQNHIDVFVVEQTIFDQFKGLLEIGVQCR